MGAWGYGGAGEGAAKKPRLLLHPLFSFLLAALLGLAACAPATPAASSYEGVALTGAAPEFALVDQAGVAVALSDLRGQVVVVAFMDSRCLDVCPRMAADLRHVRRDLGEQAGNVAFVGVNVNAQASAVKDVRDATDAWGLSEIEGWRFLTAEPAALETVWADYHIGVVPVTGGVGQLQHTPGVYIIDAAGDWRWYLSLPNDGSAAFPEFTPVRELLLAHVRGLLEPAG